jgi:hypothetical protein
MTEASGKSCQALHDGLRSTVTEIGTSSKAPMSSYDGRVIAT